MIKQLGEQYELKRELIKNSAEVLERMLKFAKNYKPSKEEVEEPKVEERPKINIPSGDLAFITDENLYKEIVCYMDKTFPSHTATLSEKLSFDGVMKGSNSYIATAVDMFLQSINSTHRIATQKDLETNLEMFEGFSEDTGLVLRSLKGLNQDKAKYLYEQIGKANSTLPIFFDLRGLKLDEFGLPKEKDENSSRLIWTLKDGFVRLFLDWVLYLYSNDENFEDSNDYGRVVLINSEKELLK